MELDYAMSFIAEASVEYSKLYNLKFKVDWTLSLVLSLDSNMKKLCAKAQTAEAEKFIFGDIESEISAPGAFRNPKTSLDVTSPWSALHLCQDNIDALTRANIGLVNVFETANGFEWLGLLN
jgi:hypothetical protein